MREIDWNEIVQMIQRDEPLLCIDVRESFRHATMDAGGEKIPFNRITNHAIKLAPFKDVTTVVCCLRPKGSKRTEKAAAALRKIGFTDVRELKNGLYNGWIQKVGAKNKLPKLIPIK
ncbi:MAG: rhodanese-like domain-containing protein [Saprospiraceae bacterium]